MARGAHAKGRNKVALVGAAVAVALVVGVVSVRAIVSLREPDIVVGAPANAATPTSGPSIILPPAEPAPPVSSARPSGEFSPFVSGSGVFGQPGPEPRATPGIKAANGRPWPPAVTFTSTQEVPAGLMFVLVIGSDARKGEDVRHSRADSLHLVAVNPATRQGTMVGIPRDSWVELPGKGQFAKINDALARGGPDLVVKTVRKLTGLPIDYYVLTGFAGFTALVNDIGGIDVKVERRMNDKLSGARFERGWHHFNGGEALAFSRNRHDVAYGDFSRSEHHGVVMLAGLAKLRAEVAEDNGLMRWANFMLKRVELNVPLSKLPQLAALARQLEPSRIANVVAPGRVGTAGGASVVYLTKEAATLFNDLRDDAVTGSASPLPITTTSVSTTTSTTAAPTTTTSTTRVITPSTTASTIPLPTSSTLTPTSSTTTSSSSTTTTTSSTTSTSTTTSTTTKKP